MKLKRQRVRTQDVIEIGVGDLTFAKDLPSDHAIWKLIHPEDAIQQVACLKQVTDQLLKDTSISSNLAVIEILVLAFMKCSIKNPSKRVIASCLQKLSGQEAYSSHIRTSIATYLRTQFQYYSESKESSDFQQIHENISILQENFSAGTDGLIATGLQGPMFMMKCLSGLNQVIRTQSMTPIAKGDHMACCMRIVKNFNKLLPKFPPTLLQCSPGHTTKGDFIEVERIFVKSLMTILSDENFLMDCRITCGITLSLLFKVHEGPNYVDKIVHNLIGRESVSGASSHKTAWLPDDVDFNSWRSTLNVLSQLCILNGCLAVINDEDLVKHTEGIGFVLTDVIGPELVSLTKGLTDSNTKLVASRTLLLFTVKTSTCLFHYDGNHLDLLRAKLSCDGVLMNQMLQYAWNHWEDQTDALRHQAVAIFQNIIKCHMTATSFEPKEDPFFCNLTKSLLALEWSTKGKYEPLCVLVEYMTSSHMLTLTPDLPNLILYASGDNVIASYANELLEKLFTNHYREFGLQPNVDPNLWNDTWAAPVLEALCSKNKYLRQNIIQYTIPKILKCNPESLFYIKEKLTSNNNDLHCLGALVTCLKRAKMMGILKSLSQSLNDVWTSSLPVAVMRHPDEQVRLDTYGLLCENIRTTEVLNEHDMALIKEFLPLNLWSQNPAFRQQLDAYSKKLFIRLRESAQPLVKAMRNRNAQTSEDAMSKLEEYKAFIEWLVDLIFDNIHQGASFPCRTTALCLLSTMVRIFSEDTKSAEAVPWSYCLQHITSAKVQTLLECFNDTFDSNMQEAYYILRSLPQESFGLWDHDVLKNLLSIALDLASSTNPQECSTAAYLFRYLILQPELVEVINRMSLDDPVPHEWTQMKDVNKTPADTLKIRQSLRRAARVKVLSLDDKQKEDARWRSLQVLQLLLSHLEDQLDIAKKSLVNAAATRPMYPTLHCIKQILEDTDLRALADNEQWTGLISKLITISFEVAEVVSPVVQNSSPEGNVPEESIIGPGLSLGAMSNSDGNQLSEIIQESAATVCLMPEYLVVCCWRSIKEVSLMLGQLTQCAPLANDDVPGLMNREQLQEIGEFFTVQLLESRHRGAFELAYAGFVKMTEMLWRCPVKDVHKWPSLWLEDVMKDIRSCDPNSRLCSTRRSAGVPFYVQALVSTEPNFQGRPCFQNVIKELLKLAEPSEENQEHEDTSQVHSLNILRALFRDTRLAEDVFPFIGSGLQVAVLGYASRFWSVRNSSTLLFSCLMTRIFGVNRTKDESSKKNCLTGRVFFHRFPNLFPFLLEKLSLATEDIADVTKLQPGLYPVLMVLGRLVPSVLEATEPNINLAAFIPLVVKCGSSGIFKTRLMSARALAPLVGRDHLMTTLQMLVDSLKPKEGILPCQNIVHGTLLQLQYILNSLEDMQDLVLEKIGVTIVPTLLALAQWILSRENKCLVTKSSCLELSLMLVKIKWPKLPNETAAELRKLENMIILHSLKQSGDDNLPLWTPWLSQYRQMNIKVLLSNFHKLSSHVPDHITIVIQAIKSPFYEARIDVLQFLNLILTYKTDDNDSWMEIDKNHWDLNSDQINSINTAVHQSKELFTTLWQVCLTEKHPECLAEVLRVLTRFNLDSEPENALEQPKSALESMDYFINLWTYAREEVCCAGLELSGMLVTNIYTSATKDSCKDASEMLQRWMLLLQEKCRMESSYDCRMSCARVLLQNAPLLLLDPKDALGGKCLDLWGLVFRLLLDEEEEIRVTMATVSTKLSAHTEALGLASPVQSEYALDLCLKVICWDLGQRRPSQVMEALLKWTLQDLEPDLPESDSKKVRLFDRSELNTYRDNLALSQLVSKHLQDLLTAATGDLLQDTCKMLHKQSEELKDILQNSPDTQDNWPFLHTIQWKDATFQLCRLTLVFIALKQVTHGSMTQQLQQSQKLLKDISSILKLTTQSMPFNYLLQKMDNFLEKADQYI